jgi:hypothetical protein
MAVRRFRSVEEMDGYRWYEPGDPVLFRAIRRVWELGYRTVRPQFPAGIHKHRTLASKNALLLGRRELCGLPAEAEGGAGPPAAREGLKSRASDDSQGRGEVRRAAQLPIC